MLKLTNTGMLTSGKKYCQYSGLFPQMVLVNSLQFYIYSKWFTELMPVSGYNNLINRHCSTSHLQ